MTVPLLSVRQLSVNFEVHQNKRWPWSTPDLLHAVNKVNFDLAEGRTLGIVGESGCGKSTLARAICGLVTPSAGEVLFGGTAINYNDGRSLASARRQMQMIFQDPMSSLNPRMTVREIITEPLRLSQVQGDHLEMAHAILDRVGIPQRNMNRYPHEFSGGQCQRIGIARALVTKPRLLICDEPVSALDVSIQAQVINLLQELQEEMGLTLLFVAHDLGVVRHMADQILVMYLGGTMEYGDVDQVVENPGHPYTEALLSAVPVPDPGVTLTPQILSGDLPSPLNPPAGCLFSTRCPKRQGLCHEQRPEVSSFRQQQVACHLIR